ncbi:Dynein light chain, flagellar outer arm, partial [Monoraphidium neglectum]
MSAVAAGVDAAGASSAAQPAVADPRSDYACKDQHSVRVIDSHMPEDLERDVLLVSAAAVERHRQLKDVAQFVKQGMQRLHPGGNRAADGVYHCAVGKSFASAVSHEVRQYIHLRVDSIHV